MKYILNISIILSLICTTAAYAGSPTQIISTDNNKQPGNSASGAGTTSGSPTWGFDSTKDSSGIVFDSAASNLIPNDTNGQMDIFYKDVMFDTLSRINVVTTSGAQATGGNSTNPVISSVNPYIAAYQSLATNLVSNDTNNVNDIFFTNVNTLTTKRILGNNNNQLNNHSRNAAISEDGNWIAYESLATNILTSNHDHNGSSGSDIFVYDKANKNNILISRAYGLSGITYSKYGANGTSHSVSIDNTGRYFTYLSAATDLVSNLTFSNPNEFRHVYLYDRVKEAAILVDAADSGNPSNSNTTLAMPQISGNGKYVIFASKATDIMNNPEPGDPYTDVFLAKIAFNSNQKPTGVEKMMKVSVGPQGQQAKTNHSSPSISDDGRYISFFASNPEEYIRDLYLGTVFIVSIDRDPDEDGLFAFEIPNEFAFYSRVEYPVATSIQYPSVTGGTAAGDAKLSGSGQHIIQSTNAANLVSNDTNQLVDVFLQPNPTHAAQGVGCSLNNGPNQSIIYMEKQGPLQMSEEFILKGVATDKAGNPMPKDTQVTVAMQLFQSPTHLMSFQYAGCDLYLPNYFLSVPATKTNIQGEWSLTIEVPNDLQLTGKLVGFQAYWKESADPLKFDYGTSPAFISEVDGLHL